MSTRFVRTATVVALAIAAFVLGRLSAPGPPEFRAGDDSLKFNIEIGEDEIRGSRPERLPSEIKAEIATVLEGLRTGVGLTPETEHNVESFFTVADAFEADGLLVQSADVLRDLLYRLQALAAARSGAVDPDSLIQSEDDILHYRDSHNLHSFDSKYMAGAQPTEKGYRWLKSKGVTTIINLRLPSKQEQNILEQLDMKYVHIPWPDEQPPSMDQVEQMLEVVKNAQGRVMQHCLRGIGRDMTMAGCYKIATYGESAEEFIDSGRKEAPRWESDQKRDPQSGEPVQFQLLKAFEERWKSRLR